MGLNFREHLQAPLIAAALQLGCQPAQPIHQNFKPEAEAQPEVKGQITPQQICYDCRDHLAGLGQNVRGLLRDIAQITTCTKGQRDEGNMQYVLMAHQQKAEKSEYVIGLNDLKNVVPGNVWCHRAGTMYGLDQPVSYPMGQVTLSKQRVEDCMKLTPATDENGEPADEPSDQALLDRTECLNKAVEKDSANNSPSDEDILTAQIDEAICERKNDETVLGYLQNKCTPAVQKMKLEIPKLQEERGEVGRFYFDEVAENRERSEKMAGRRRAQEEARIQKAADEKTTQEKAQLQKAAEEKRAQAEVRAKILREAQDALRE